MDRCVLEIVIENLAKLYEDEEREIHYREQTDKKRRVRNFKMILYRMKSVLSQFKLKLKTRNSRE